VPATFDHNQYFVLDRDHNARCVTCHLGNDYKRYTCYGCHEHTPDNIRREHIEEASVNLMIASNVTAVAMNTTFAGVAGRASAGTMINRPEGDDPGGVIHLYSRARGGFGLEAATSLHLAPQST